MSSPHVLNDMLGLVGAFPVFSDHEHHQTDAFFAEPMTLDKALACSYVAWTGFQTGGTREGRARLLDNAGFNSYFHWFEQGFRRVHNVEEPISLENWDALSDKAGTAHAADPDFHWKTLLANGYRRLILDTYWNPGDDNGHPEVFSPTFRIDKFMYGFHADSIAPDDFIPWNRYGFTGGSLDDFVALMRHAITTRHAAGEAVALKCAEAYNRDIMFVPDDREAAEDAFNTPPDRISLQARTLFSNYIFNRACELAGELGIPFQVHTGLARLSGSNPLNLLPVIQRYPGTRFVLFHSGYPWTQECAAIAHNHHNVCPSMTWTVTICTSAAIRTLHDFIDAAPSVNTITWGSDCWVPEESIGALLGWRFVVASVLADRIEDGRLDPPRAEKLAAKLMSENGRHVYGC